MCGLSQKRPPWGAYGYFLKQHIKILSKISTTVHENSKKT